MSDSLYERVGRAAVHVRSLLPSPVPGVAVVLGSGLGPLAEALSDRVVIPYAQIPCFPTATVAGHSGNLVFGRVGATPVLFMQGRVHYYEGHDLDAVTFGVRVLCRLGVATLVLTAATGGVNPALGPGTIVLVSDHLNLLGANPLRGPNDERIGTRFPDMSAVYSRRLGEHAKAEAFRLGIDLADGVYACLPGPSYETPAEIRMLRTLGADVVGMSTVPEAIAARHAGMDVLAFALVTNAAAGVTAAPVSHAEVLEAGRQALPRFGALLEAVLPRLSPQSVSRKPISW